MSEYRKQLEDWLSGLDIKADKVYDIGGGQGEVKKRVKSWDVKHYKVLDLPEFDLESLDYKMWSLNDPANIIFCLEVFEYLIDPVTAIKNLASVLAGGGKAYITFAFVYPHHNELERDSLRYTETGIHRLADIAGLKVANTWYRNDKSGYLMMMYGADGMRMAKQYRDHSVTGFIAEFTK